MVNFLEKDTAYKRWDAALDNKNWRMNYVIKKGDNQVSIHEDVYDINDRLINEFSLNLENFTTSLTDVPGIGYYTFESTAQARTEIETRASNQSVVNNDEACG